MKRGREAALDVYVNKGQQARWTFWRSCWRRRERGQPPSESALRPHPPSARELRAGVHSGVANFSTPKLIARRRIITPAHRFYNGPRPPAPPAVADAAPGPQWPRTAPRDPAISAAPRPDTLRRPRHTALAAVHTIAVRHLGGRAQGSAQEEDILHEEAHPLHGRQGHQGPHKPEQMLRMREGKAGSLPMSLLRRRYVLHSFSSATEKNKTKEPSDRAGSYQIQHLWQPLVVCANAYTEAGETVEASRA